MTKDTVQVTSIFAVDLAMRAGEVIKQERRKDQLEHVYKCW